MNIAGLGRIFDYNDSGWSQLCSGCGEIRINRYRLHLVHADGRSVWSDIIAVGTHCNVSLQAAERFTLYPNPTTSRVTISKQDAVGTWQWKLTDITGKALQQGSLTRQELSKENMGVYFTNFGLAAWGDQGLLKVKYDRLLWIDQDLKIHPIWQFEEETDVWTFFPTSEEKMWLGFGREKGIGFLNLDEGRW